MTRGRECPASFSGSGRQLRPNQAASVCVFACGSHLFEQSLRYAFRFGVLFFSSVFIRLCGYRSAIRREWLVVVVRCRCCAEPRPLSIWAPAVTNDGRLRVSPWRVTVRSCRQPRRCGGCDTQCGCFTTPTLFGDAASRPPTLPWGACGCAASARRSRPPASPRRRSHCRRGGGGLCGASAAGAAVTQPRASGRGRAQPARKRWSALPRRRRPAPGRAAAVRLQSRRGPGAVEPTPFPCAALRLHCTSEAQVQSRRRLNRHSHAAGRSHQATRVHPRRASSAASRAGEDVGNLVEPA